VKVMRCMGYCYVVDILTRMLLFTIDFVVEFLSCNFGGSNTLAVNMMIKYEFFIFLVYFYIAFSYRLFIRKGCVYLVIIFPYFLFLQIQPNR